MRTARWLLALLVAVVPMGPARADAAPSLTLTINSIDATRFPTTLAYVTVADEKGKPVFGLRPSDFSLTEEGVAVPGVELSTAVNVQEPLSAVLTIDVSGSMRDGGGLESEKRAAAVFIDSLRPQDRASVIAFSSDVRTVLGFTSDKAALMDAINSLQAGGNTALYDALFWTVDAARQASTARRIAVFMTDGENNASKAALDDGLNYAKQQGVPVYTIGLGAEVDPKLLARIAQQTGGSHIFAPTPAALVDSYQAIADQLRQQYVLSYQSPKPRGARSYALTINVNAGGERASAQTSYRANPPAPAIQGVSLADGATLTEATAVSVLFNAAVPVASIVMTVNGRPVAEATEPPYTLTLDPGNLTAGRHEVGITLRDTAGSEAAVRLYAVVPVGVGMDHLAEPAAAPPISMPQIQIPEISFAGFSLPEILLPEIDLSGWLPDFSSVLAALSQAAEAAAEKLPVIGLMLAAAVAAVLDVRRLRRVMGASMEWVTCEVCGNRHRAYRGFCSVCAERQQSRAREERGLAELLVQNNLLDQETLEAALVACQERNMPLEELLLEEGKVSPPELAKARYYLSRSQEMSTRVEKSSRPARRWPVTPTMLLPHLGVQLLVLVIWVSALPSLWQ